MTASTAVVIVGYHRPEPLRRSVPSLIAAGLEVVVVNVEADPEVAQLALDAGAVEVPIVDNVGFAAAVNAGVQAARAPVVIFMNDDLTVGPEALMRLADLVHSGACSVAVPAVVNAAGSREPTISALPTVGRLFLEWTLTPDHRPPGMPRLGVQKWREPSSRERVQAATAAIVACRRTLLVGLPLPTAYFLYWEESEWFWHLHRQGVDVWYEPSVVVRHDGGRDDLRAVKAMLLARNAVRCVRRTQGRAAAGLAWPVVVLWNGRLLLTAFVRAVLRPSPRRRQDLQVRLAGFGAACRSGTEVA